MGNDWNWGPEATVSESETDEALRKVIHHGKRRQRRRRTAIGSATAVLVIGVFVGGMASTDRDDADRDVVTVTEARSEAPVTVQTPATQPPRQPSPVARPLQLVTSENDNAGNARLLVRDGSSGRLIRTLDSRRERIGRVALDNEAKTVYYEVFEQVCDGPSLRSISIAGGDSVRESEFGNSPAVSPDGTKLAFNASAGCDVGSRIAVKDLRTGTVTYVVGNDASEVSGERTVTSSPGTVTWIDDATIAVSVTTYPETAPNKVDGLYAYDIDRVEMPYSSGRRLTISSQTGSHLSSISRMRNGLLYAVQTCCDSSRDSQLGTTSQARMIVIDPKTGDVVRTVATGFPDRRYVSPRADNSTSHLLYLSNDDLRISSNGNNPEVLISGVTSADWK